LFLRTDIDVNVTQVRNPVNVTLSDGSIRNAYDLRLRNMTGQDTQFSVMMVGPEGMTLTVEGADGPLISVPADQTLAKRVFVQAAAGSEAAGEERSELRLWVSDSQSTSRVHQDTIFFGKDD